jgi:hypothetical protein
VNWGGAAIDRETGFLYANINRLASVIRLVTRRVAERERIENQGIAITEGYLGYLPEREFGLGYLFWPCSRVQTTPSLNPGWAPVFLVAGTAFMGGTLLYFFSASSGHPADS